MYVSSWLINPIRTLQVDAYQNQGTTAEPKFVLQSTYTHAGGLSYFTFTALLNRTNAKTGLPIYDFLLTNGTETVYVLRNNVSMSKLYKPYLIDILANRYGGFTTYET